MKIKLNQRAAFVGCTEIVIGILVIAMVGMAIVVVIKVLKCIPVKGTNDEPQLRLRAPLLLPRISVPLPAGAIAIQRSASMDRSVWETLNYMTLATNAGTITLTTFDGTGRTTGSYILNPGQTNQVDMLDINPMEGRNFYRAAQ